MKLLLSSPVMRVLLFLRLSDVYDPLQIFVHETGTHEITMLMVLRTIDPVFRGDDLSRHDAYILLKLPLIMAGWSRKSVSPPPPWL